MIALNFHFKNDSSVTSKELSVGNSSIEKCFLADPMLSANKHMSVRHSFNVRRNTSFPSFHVHKLQSVVIS